MLGFISLVVVAAGLLTTQAAPTSSSGALKSRAATDKLVFAHFMIGIVSDRTSAADYDDDMQRAKAIGIDAFALNIGTDQFTDTQLGYAYDSAANNGMNVFISFDFNWWSPSQGSAVGTKISQYASKPAQLKVDNKVFVSSFSGDGLDIDAVRSAAGVDLFIAPNFHPSSNDFGSIDAALNWLAWDSNGNNKAPTSGANVTVSQGDQEYISALAGKPYIAPVSPWFSTHYGPEVSYSKNWVFPSDLLWYNRWNNILSLSPQYIEIITWNDYGESHYIGPLSSEHYDDGASKWANDMPHDGWLDMAVPFIAAFKAGSTSVAPFITKDQIIYWYRQNLKSLDCDSTDTCMVQANNASGNYFLGRPDGYNDMADSVFVVTLLQNAGQLTVNSGSNSQSFNAPVGASSFTLPMSTGQQSFIVSRNGVQVSELTGASLKDITDVCNCGIYNFNAYVGSLPAGSPDPMGADGLNSLTVGLHVTTCQARPSLPTSPASITASDAQNNGGGAPSSPTSAPTTTAQSAPSTVSATAASTTPMQTSVPPTTTTEQGGCTSTITTSSQIFPTNCLAKGECWAGPPGEATPDHCDGH